MTTRTATRPTRQVPRPRRRPPRLSTVEPHPFALDRDIPADWAGRAWCRTCSLAGAQGDARHPDDVPPRLPPAPQEAVERDAAILGERADD